MTLKQAVDRINTWAVTGVNRNFGLDDVPGVIPEADLPALVFDWGKGLGGSDAFDLAITKAQVVVELDHLLLVCGAGMDRAQERLYRAVTLFDNYHTKLLTDWTLNNYLAEPLKIMQTSFGVMPVYNVLYYGIRFRHRWVLVL